MEQNPIKKVPQCCDLQLANGHLNEYLLDRLKSQRHLSNTLSNDQANYFFKIGTAKEMIWGDIKTIIFVHTLNKFIMFVKGNQILGKHVNFAYPHLPNSVFLRKKLNSYA